MDTTKDRKKTAEASPLLLAPTTLPLSATCSRTIPAKRESAKSSLSSLTRTASRWHPTSKKAQRLQNVKVYRIPGRVSLGKCLNFGVSKANYSLVAKFDHDDYYAPNYLNRAIRAMKRKNADVVGKRTIFYLSSIQKKASRAALPGKSEQVRRARGGRNHSIQKKEAVSAGAVFQYFAGRRCEVPQGLPDARI